MNMLWIEQIIADPHEFKWMVDDKAMEEWCDANFKETHERLRG